MLPSLTQADIQAWAGPASFERGLAYFQRGAIRNPRRQGTALKAECLGSQAPSYAVEALLGPQGIVAATCSCPVGEDGRCKHVAALLLAWLDDPDSFREAEALEQFLQRRSKADLIALIQQMIRRYPDLGRLIELASVPEQAAGEPLDPAVIRRQVEQAFDAAGYEWGAQATIVKDLRPVLELGEAYIARDDYANAATVYEEVARVTLEHENLIMEDEGGDLHRVVGECARRLDECLAQTADQARRDTILRALFDIYAWDVNAGGVGIGDWVPNILMNQASPAEKRRIAGWVEAALPAGGDTWSATYHRQVFGGLWLKLIGPEIDDETFLAICRRTGRADDLVDRLLKLGRVEEAVFEAGRATDYELLSVADLFVHHGHVAVGERLVRERSKTSKDYRLVEWLKEHARGQGDLAEALAWAEDLFWRRPSVEDYRQMRELAQALGRWPAVRTETLARLEKDKAFTLLTQLYLDEGDIDLALQALEQAGQAQSTRHWWDGSTPSVALQVAEAAEETRPEAAIRLYMQEAERLIAQRGRNNYEAAAYYLLRVRDLYRRLGQPDAWQTLIQRLREQNRSLRALKDVLNKAGL